MTKTRWYELLRWVAALAAVLLIFSMCGRDAVSSTPAEEVCRAVTGALSLDQMQQGDNQMIKRLYGLTPSDFEACTLYYPLTNMDAQELLILRMRDKSQAELVRNAVQARLEGQKKSFDGYGVEQYALLTEHAVIEIRGCDVLFVVHPDSDKALRAFLDAL